MSGRGAFLAPRRALTMRRVVIPSVMAVTASTAANNSSYTSSVGHVFTVSAAGLVVTHLALRDADGNGVSGSVGLWTNAGTLLASASFSGTSDPIESGYRVQGITPLALAAGTYRIASFETGGGYYRNEPPTGFFTFNTFSGKVSVTLHCFGLSPGLVFPSDTGSLSSAVFSNGGFKGY